MHTILLLSQEKALEEVLLQFCERENYVCHVCSTWEEADQYIVSKKIRLLLVHNVTFAEEIARSVPILTLGERSIKGEKGLPFPLHVTTLFTAITKALNSPSLFSGNLIFLGSYVLDNGTRTLALPNTSLPLIHLTEKETDILLCLYQEDTPLDTETLLNRVWGYNSDIDTHTLQTHIYRLRQKIEAAGGSDTLIVTEEGKYRLVGS